MLAWWTFATLCTGALAVAAWMIERVLRGAGIAARGSWALVLLAGVAWPAIAWLRATPSAVGLVSPRSVSPTLVAFLRDAVSAAYVRASAVDAWLPGVWLAASVTLMLAALASQRHLAGVARRCHPARITGVEVRLGASEGPAVFGLTRPCILMPSWITGSTVRERRLALVHELSHIRAGDLPLLWASFTIVCLAPWNAAAWWTLHRLRQAVEVDCDRRVLRRRRANERTYGNLLIRAAQTGARLPAPVSGLSSRRALLRRRVEQIAPHTTVGAGIRARWALAALATIVGAAMVLPAPKLRASTLGQIRATELPRAEIREAPTFGRYRVGPLPDGAAGVLRARARPGGDPGEPPPAEARFSPRRDLEQSTVTLRERPGGDEGR